MCLEDDPLVHSNDPVASWSGDIDGIVKTLRMLLGHALLKNLNFRKSPRYDITEVSDKVVKGRPEWQDIVKVGEAEGNTWYIRMFSGYMNRTP